MANEQPKVKVVDFRRAAREMALKLLRRACDTVECEPNIAGYVIIAWDHRGAATTTVDTQDGPIGNGMVAEYVRTVIARRLAAEDAVYDITGGAKPPDEGA